MMTEQESEKKYCPATFGRCGGGSGWCVGSACAAWRWVMEAGGETRLYRRTPIPGQSGHFDNSPVGYCGLARRP